MDSSRKAPARASTTLLRAAAAACALFLSSGAASAQYADEPVFLIPPRALVWRLSDRGFTEIGRPRFDGRAYVVEAVGPYGDRVRLFLDARDGGILGRQRLETPFPPPARIARPGAGYGWTDEDMGLRRSRGAERLLPPADIPTSPGPVARLPQPRGEGGRSIPERSQIAGRSDPADAMGLNPDAGRRRPDAPRKTVRLAPPPTKPAEPGRAATPAPGLRGNPSDAASPVQAPAAPLQAPAARAQDPAAVEPPREAQSPATAAAIQPTPETAARTAETRPAAQAWKDPPADGKRPVRVIDGATVVPGTVDKATGTPP